MSDGSDDDEYIGLVYNDLNNGSRPHVKTTPVRTQSIQRHWNAVDDDSSGDSSDDSSYMVSLSIPDKGDTTCRRQIKGTKNSSSQISNQISEFGRGSTTEHKICDTFVKDDTQSNLHIKCDDDEEEEEQKHSGIYRVDESNVCNLTYRCKSGTQSKLLTRCGNDNNETVGQLFKSEEEDKEDCEETETHKGEAGVSHNEDGLLVSVWENIVKHVRTAAGDAEQPAKPDLLTFVGISRGMKHGEVMCFTCQTNIYGPRYSCRVCTDFDLCHNCYMWGGHSYHPMECSPFPASGESEVFGRQWLLLCNACGRALCEDVFKCRECPDYDLCVRCHEDPDIHKEHKEQRVRIPAQDLGFKTIDSESVLRQRTPLHEECNCHHCLHPIYGTRYTCTECQDYDLCGDCMNSDLVHQTEHRHAKEQMTTITLPQSKGLREWKIVCDACGLVIRDNLLYRCRRCDDYDWCHRCVPGNKRCNCGDKLQGRTLQKSAELHGIGQYWHRLVQELCELMVVAFNALWGIRLLPGLVSSVTPVDTPRHWRCRTAEEKPLELNPDCREYQDVAALFYAESVMMERFDIVKVERIQNPWLYRKYCVHSRELDLRNPPGTHNEMRLWHGTRSDVIRNITASGFNRSYCGYNASVYGYGVYFARDASYSAKKTYSPMDEQKHKRAYLSRVLTGLYTEGHKDYREPPLREVNSHKRFDSVVDKVDAPAKFVVFSDTQSYPEYLVTFTRRKKVSTKM